MPPWRPAIHPGPTETCLAGSNRICPAHHVGHPCLFIMQPLSSLSLQKDTRPPKSEYLLLAAYIPGASCSTLADSISPFFPSHYNSVAGGGIDELTSPIIQSNGTNILDESVSACVEPGP
jgi:hypothetical protein